MNRETRMDVNTSQTGMLSESMIRSVLKEWDSLAALGSHPVANLGIVENCRQLEGYTPTSTGRGLALRQVIQSAIDTLKPAGESHDWEEKNWRRFTILQEQFVHARSPEWVAQQLHISKGTYYGEQKRALQILADILCKWEEERLHHPASDRLPHRELPLAVPSAPFMVPAQPPHLVVGRDQLISDLVRRLKSGMNRGLIALVGLPGVGKTTTTIELAHHPEIFEHFRDGILWAALGREPDIAAQLARWATAVGAQSEVSTENALYGIRAQSHESAVNSLYGVKAQAEVSAHPTLYGVSAQPDIAAHPALYGVSTYTDIISERAAAVHTAIGMRRMLLIIDDAWRADAALAFKVGGPNCAYLLTTRMANVALDFAGDQVIAVHELEFDDGLDLLTQMAGPAIETDPDAARSLIQLTGGSPLAIILMGQHLQKQSYHLQARRMRDALAELKSARRRMELAQSQSALEQRTDLPSNTPLTLQTSIGISDTALDYSVHRALVALALFPPKPNSFSEEAALVVIQAPSEVLDTLVDCGLVESIAPDRYTIHRTIVDYASLEEAEPDAIERMVNYFVCYVERYASDFQTLDLELENILRAAEFAFRSKLYHPLIRLVDALYLFMTSREMDQIVEHLLSQASTAASAIGDSEGQVTCLCRLGEIAVKQGAADTARAYFEQVVAIACSAQLRHWEKAALLHIQRLGEL